LGCLANNPNLGCQYKSHGLRLKALLPPLAILLGLSILGAIVTWLLAPLVIGIIAGDGDFTGSIHTLRILAFGFPAFFGSSLLMWVFVALKKYKLLSAIYLLGLFLNIILNLIFIPQFSYLASAWITGVCEYLILVLQLLILLLLL
jgi:O-antigen/teichoic acid export membrane protein